MNILKRTLVGLLVVFLAFGQVTSIPGTVDAVMGFSNLTTAGRMVGVASSGNVTEYSDFIRTAAGRFQIYDSTGPSQLKLRGGSSQDTGPTSLIEMYSSANVLRASFDNIGQFSWIQSNGTTKSVTVGDVVRIGSTKGLYWSSSSGADGSLVLGLTRASDYNLGITNASSTTYWTIGAAGIQCGSGDGNSSQCDGGTTGARFRNINAAGTGTFGGGVYGPNGSSSAPGISFSSSTGTGLYWDGSYLNFAVGGTRVGYIRSADASFPNMVIAGASQIRSAADGNLTIANNANNGFGLLQFGGTTNLFPALKRFGNAVAVRAADDTISTFATLTACSASGEGALASISDSATAVWGLVVTGGGSNHILAYCNGTDWTVAAK